MEKIDCLALRQKLKETIRARLRKENGFKTTTAISSSDKYGEFFGPSEVVLADRLLQKTQLWSDAVEELDKNFKKDPDHESHQVKKPSKKKGKVESIRESRDYSFLSSDDCEIPEKKSCFNQEILKRDCLGLGFPKTLERMMEKSSDSRDSKRVINYEYLLNGKSSKTLESKVKKIRVSYVGSKKPYQHMINKPCKKEDLSTKKKTTIKSSQSQQKINPCHREIEICHGIKRKQIDQNQKQYNDYQEDGNAISIIRDMLGYNPSDYSSDDDSNMEVSFADIQKEERRSAKIAKKEDEEELKKLVREEYHKKKLKKIN